MTGPGRSDRRGRPRKYEIEPIDATAKELAQAIFRAAEKPKSGDEDIENGPAYICHQCGGPMPDWSSETCAACNEQEEDDAD